MRVASKVRGARRMVGGGGGGGVLETSWGARSPEGRSCVCGSEAWGGAAAAAGGGGQGRCRGEGATRRGGPSHTGWHCRVLSTGRYYLLPGSTVLVLVLVPG
jgi:hypothetical protein